MDFSAKRFFPHILIAGFIATAVALYFVESGFSVRVSAPGLEDGKLTEAERLAFDHMIGLSELLLSWALALMGAVALFFRGIGRLRIGIWQSLLIFFLLLLSMFFGLLVLELSIQKLVQQQFPVVDPMVTRARWFQYLTFAVGLVALISSVIGRAEWNGKT